MQSFIILLISLASIAADPVAVAEERSAATCPQGWIEFPSETSDLCIKTGPPLQFVNWMHMQQTCAHQGGYLPEPTAANKDQLEFTLKTLEQLYGRPGKVLMFLGANDISHELEFKWMKSKLEVTGANIAANYADGVAPTTSEDNTKTKKGCLAQESTGLKWVLVDWEEDSMKTEEMGQIADICFGTKSSAKPFDRETNKIITQ